MHIRDTVFDTIISDKVGYTGGGDFSLTGSDYIGYYNVLDGRPFAGRFSKEIPLNSYDNINTKIILSKDLYFDRVVSDVISLPYSLDELYFQPNEIINKNTLNLKISQLYDNFVEIFRYGKFPSPKIPVNNTGIAVVSSVIGPPAFGDEFITWLPTNTVVVSSNSTLPSFRNYNEAFNGTSDYNLDIMKSRFDDKYTLFLSSKNTIFSYEVDDPAAGEQHQTFNFTASTNAIGDYSSLTFDKIANTANNSRDTLFVADSGNNAIVKLDVSNIVNLDRTGVRNFKYIDSIGGTGDNETNFQDIQKIIYGDNFIYVYDKGEKVIKQFSEDLIFIKKYTNNKLFNENVFVNFAYNVFDKNLYILFENKKIFVIETGHFQKKDEFILDVNDFKDEKLEKILFSENNSNIFYIQTDYGVYKYLLSRKNKLIAEWQLLKNLSFDINWEETNFLWDLNFDNWEGFSNGPDNYNYLDIDILASENNFDKLVFISTKNILEYSENMELLSLFSKDDPDFYDLDEMEFSFEYFNNITLNVAFYKLLYNHSLLANRISKKVSLKFDNRGVKIFDDISHINPEDKLQINLDNTKDFYVGMNETTSLLVFNRIIESFYNYQLEIIKLLDIETINIKNPPLSTIIF